jgi:NADPH-dependent curcumin reductase CurA
MRESACVAESSWDTALETVIEGLDAAPAAFLSLLRGGNVGKDDREDHMRGQKT